MPVNVLHQAAVSAGAAFPATAFPWIPLNLHATPFHANYVINKTGSGQTRLRVQGTMENVQESGVSAFAFTIHELASVQAPTAVSREVSAPWAAVRLIVASASASSNVAFRLTQAGI